VDEISRGRVAGAVGDASFHGAVGGLESLMTIDGSRTEFESLMITLREESRIRSINLYA
jgi:serine phosphatase RsbU (regulator of sigma subunit)